MSERCTSSDRIPIKSHSSTRTYIVSFAEGIPMCGFRDEPGRRLQQGCPAYAIGKNRQKALLEGRHVANGPDLAWCKHIDEAYNKGLVCTWTGESIIPGICPQCGSPTQPV